jgi:hypothetical protein
MQVLPAQTPFKPTMAPLPQAAPPAARNNMRIPATLQAVYRPPPEKVASMIFFRNWFFQRKAGSKGREGLWSSKEKSHDKQKTYSEITTTLKSGLKAATVRCVCH